jgi:hypothetical protein
VVHDHRPGDKVKLKDPQRDLSSRRGVVAVVDSDRLTVRVNGTSLLVTVAPDGVTNFSLAARKAWQNMPKRNVGRPKGSKVSDRVSVTIRVDRDLWERFRQAEADGIIHDRTSTLNGWISEQLKTLRANDRKAS